MKNIFSIVILVLALMHIGCNSTASKQAEIQNPEKSEKADSTFSAFENTFLDAYWRQHPSAAIQVGYGKYYENLNIPDSNGFKALVSFSKSWIDSLNSLHYDQLSDNNKISYNILKNQLESDIWYISVFKQQEWDASIYNLSADCDYIINQPYAHLAERLRILSGHLQHSDDYYRAALATLNRPTKEHIELAILQNEGGLSLFGSALNDSIKASHLNADEVKTLQQNIGRTKEAIQHFVEVLKGIVANKKAEYRDFRIGKKLFTEKFKF
ncbi:MAG: DUF885 family protein, partial [Saprospiraceae bacterium]